MVRVELTCDRCKRRTLVDVGGRDRIEHWTGGPTGQYFSLEGLYVPAAWRFFFDVQELVRVACPDCVGKEPRA